MSSADIVILIVIGLLSYYGWHRGIIRSAFNFAGLTLGALVAALYLPRLLPDTFAGGSGSFAMIIGILIGALLVKQLQDLLVELCAPLLHHLDHFASWIKLPALC